MEMIYNEPGLEYLKDSRRWMRRLCLFHKTYNLKSPKYLFNLIPHNCVQEITQISHLLNAGQSILRILSFQMS